MFTITFLYLIYNKYSKISKCILPRNSSNSNTQIAQILLTTRATPRGDSLACRD